MKVRAESESCFRDQTAKRFDLVSIKLARTMNASSIPIPFGPPSGVDS
jgi:hypothetical protein